MEPGNDTSYVQISLSPDLHQLVDENGIDLLSELHNQGLALTRVARPDIAPPAEEGDKSAELLLLCGAAAAPLVAAGIVRIIHALGSRATVVERRWSPVIDASGAVVRGVEGNPLMEWREVTGPASAVGTTSRSKTAVRFLGLDFHAEDAHGSNTAAERS